jgi:hypothetical protein
MDVKISVTDKRSATSSFPRVLQKARKDFEVQVEKNNETKRKCLERYIGAYSWDVERFYLKLQDQSDKLEDSKKFCTECETLGVVPEIIAEHIAFLGNPTLNKVLKDGIKNTIGNDYSLYTEKFTPTKTGAPVTK